FQAEDGIRDFHVTGVQTCALPISATTPAMISAAPNHCTRVGTTASSTMVQTIPNIASEYPVKLATVAPRRRDAATPSTYDSTVEMSTMPETATAGGSSVPAITAGLPVASKGSRPVALTTPSTTAPTARPSPTNGIGGMPWSLLAPVA